MFFSIFALPLNKILCYTLMLLEVYFMNLLNYVTKITGINNNYFTSSIESILVLFILRLVDKVFQFINNKFNKNDKNKYKLNKRIHLITNIIIIIAFVIIWQDYFKNFLTLISFVSAALTFALRDIILNFFSGIYIKINKPFNVSIEFVSLFFLYIA